MPLDETREIRHDLYDAAMDGIPAPCRQQRCGQAYLEALAHCVTTEAFMENFLHELGMPHITAGRVTRDVSTRIGVFCANECSGAASTIS